VAAVKCLFNRFIDWGKLQANPCRGIKQFPEPPRTHWLEAGQVKRLLEECSDRVRPIIEVALLTGLRQGDILRLTWDRIDFEQRLMRIVQRKTQTSLVLPVSKALTGILNNLPRNMDCPYVFHENGKPLRRYGWVRTDFKKATVAAGLAGTRFHDLRHTAATQLRRLGKDLQVVQQFLGHKSIRMTLRYSHVHPTELREAVNRLGEKMVPKGTSHFTITSQSADDQDKQNSIVSMNDANSGADSNADLSEMESISRPVNLEQLPSEEW
jgi:integrase